MFKILDKNGDGYVGYDELALVLEENGLVGVSYRELVGVISRFDLNKDGKISFSEFVNQLSPNRSLS